MFFGAGWEKVLGRLLAGCIAGMVYGVLISCGDNLMGLICSSIHDNETASTISILTCYSKNDNLSGDHIRSHEEQSVEDFPSG